MEGYKEGSNELSLEELQIIAKAASKLGIRYFKLTGGEPLLRTDIVDIARIFRSIGYVTITTNGSLLEKYAKDLSEHVNHINVSIHSLRKEVYRKITGVDGLENVLRGVKLVKDFGVDIKINFVVLKGLNEDEIDDLIELASSLEAKLQIIELHPVGRAIDGFGKYHLPATKVIKRLLEKASSVKLRRGMHNRPILLLENGVEVEIVGPVGNYAFCSACTRIRISYDGKVIPCLNWKGPAPVDLRQLMKNAYRFEEKVEAVIQGLKLANSYRRPTYLWPLSGATSLRSFNEKNMRLPLPKRDGSFSLPGRDAKSFLKQLKSEWNPQH